MNKPTHQKLLFTVCLICVVSVAAGAIFLPRYLSRALDKSRLNKVTVADRTHFSYLEQSSGDMLENIQALSFMKNESNLMLLSNMKSDTAKMNPELLTLVYDQAMAASEYGMLPWLGAGDSRKKNSYEIEQNWEDQIRFARYYSLTYDSDNDENTKELLNLWYLRFSDNETYDYYFLVNASDYTIYYAEIHNEWAEAEARTLEVWKSRSGGDEQTVASAEEDAVELIDTSESALEVGTLLYYDAEVSRYVAGDYTNQYLALLVLHFANGTAYMEENAVDTRYSGLPDGIALGFRGVEANLKQLKN